MENGSVVWQIVCGRTTEHLTTQWTLDPVCPSDQLLKKK